MHSVLEMVPYQRVRPPEEYKGHFRETDVMVRLAKEYGFENVTVESFADGQAWQPTQGELWMTTPKSVKLFDIHDLALSLASLNANGDVSGELVDIGAGTAADFAGKDLTGKFVLSAQAVERPRPDLQPGHRQGRGRRAWASARSASSGRSTIPDQIVSTIGQRHQGRHRRLERDAAQARRAAGPAARAATRSRSARSSRACRCRRAASSCTPRFPATAARRRKSRSAATCTRA